MFHLYFGAFDIILYLGASYFAMVLAKAICDELDQVGTTQVVEASEAKTSHQSLQPSTQSPVASRSERAEVQQQVTVKG
ncbi:uncharacterized protein XM38_016630 [Halomicronema hongdechloris C2206]|uniref:Uncharacterized protein n=1 Tax=Halomicronema hongdechloris C2206 TaxID=1641165 RepID=A0A1Z3HK94_9CYAN|nr:hypothetical protein [Halomicronema hongdechloris]ASC70718.1 uncharacterized protein XM38_016630 [Halomicronema hongdechloris C2206]